MKPWLFETACTFVKEQVNSITQMMTKHHYGLIKQFIKYKERSDRQLKISDKLNSHVASLEQRLAIKSPILEAEYAIDDATALSLYDCLVPKIKEHRRFRINRDSIFSIADMKAVQRVRELDYELEK